jgi:hypothetical protein
VRYLAVAPVGPETSLGELVVVRLIAWNEERGRENRRYAATFRLETNPALRAWQSVYEARLVGAGLDASPQPLAAPTTEWGIRLACADRLGLRARAEASPPGGDTAHVSNVVVLDVACDEIERVDPRDMSPLSPEDAVYWDGEGPDRIDAGLPLDGGSLDADMEATPRSADPSGCSVGAPRRSSMPLAVALAPLAMGLLRTRVAARRRASLPSASGAEA